MKLKIKLLAGFLLLCNTLMAQERSPTREASSLFSLPPFERAVRCIKFYEGFHQKRHYPYIGYGHRLLPGERLTWRLTEKQADSLLRSDLRWPRSVTMLAPTKFWATAPYPKAG